MDESYAGLPTSHLLGSVPAVISSAPERKPEYANPQANLQIFPPNNGVDKGKSSKSYEGLGSPSGGNEEPPTNSWKGYFNIASYTQYFDVDTDVVLDRIKSSLYPHHGDFFTKIDGNPDLYGLIWISTTLVFVVAAFGNCATYLMDKSSNSKTTWNFDVGYLSMAACAIYGYTLVVPTAFFFLLQYLGSSPSLVRFWCMWGYSLFIFICCSVSILLFVSYYSWLSRLLIAFLIKGNPITLTAGEGPKSYS